MEKMNNIINRTLVIGILGLFVGTCLVPSITGDYNSEQDTSKLTFYTFDRAGTKKIKAELSTDVAKDISELFDELKEKIISDPNSDETQILKNEFVEMLDTNGLISEKIPKDYVFSLLKPRWQQNSGKKVLPGPFSHTGSSFICSIAGGGYGLLFIPIMIPRPRLATVWSSVIDAQSMAANLLTGWGFVASGPQFGIALGFMGIGISFAIPGEPASFGFGGYALAAFVGGDDVDNYPLNQEPIISEENPSSGAWNIPVSLSELSFRISDPDKDLLSYTVTTSPDIGSGEGSGYNGIYSIPISGLEYDKSYSWTVSVSDGEDTVEKTFSFITSFSPPFDPFDEGWQFRKKIKIDHTKVNENLENFPVLISSIDDDIRDKAQSDGDDILFMYDTGVAEKMYHELERYNGDTGELIAWVNVNQISANEDTTFYVYYGNPSCSAQQLPERVWDLDYKAVYHMNYESGGLIDSTIYNNDCIKILGSPDFHQIGKIGYTINFDRNNNEAFEGEDFFDGLDEMTVEAWINLKEYPEPHSSHCMILTQETSWYFGINWEFKQIVFDFHGSGVETRDNISCPLNTWYYVAGTWSDMKDNVKLFGNGELKDSCIYENTMGDYNDHFSVGYKQHHSDYFNGMIDEVRVSTVQRDDNWIHTTFINQNNPLSFLSIGPEESN
jgi:hypothetical protein